MNVLAVPSGGLIKGLRPVSTSITWSIVCSPFVLSASINYPVARTAVGTLSVHSMRVVGMMRHAAWVVVLQKSPKLGGCNSLAKIRHSGIVQILIEHVLDAF